MHWTNVLVLLKCLLLFAFSRCSIVVVYYLIICKIFNGNFSGICWYITYPAVIFDQQDVFFSIRFIIVYYVFLKYYINKVYYILSQLFSP